MLDGVTTPAVRHAEPTALSYAQAALDGLSSHAAPLTCLAAPSSVLIAQWRHTTPPWGRQIPRAHGAVVCAGSNQWPIISCCATDASCSRRRTCSLLDGSQTPRIGSDPDLHVLRRPNQGIGHGGHGSTQWLAQAGDSFRRFVAPVPPPLQHHAEKAPGHGGTQWLAQAVDSFRGFVAPVPPPLQHHAEERRPRAPRSV